MVDVSYDAKDNQTIIGKNDENCVLGKKKLINEMLMIKTNYFKLNVNNVLLKRKIIYIKKEIIGLFLFLLSYLYYYLSLEICLRGESKCSLLYEWQLDRVYQELKSCILMAFIFELIFYKLI